MKRQSGIYCTFPYLNVARAQKPYLISLVTKLLFCCQSRQCQRRRHMRMRSVSRKWAQVSIWERIDPRWRIGFARYFAAARECIFRAPRPIFRERRPPLYLMRMPRRRRRDNLTFSVWKNINKKKEWVERREKEEEKEEGHLLRERQNIIRGQGCQDGSKVRISLFVKLWVTQTNPT